MSLVKKQDVKDYLQYDKDSNDGIIDRLIDRVEVDFKDEIGGVAFDASSDYTEYTEIYDGDGTNIIILPKLPIRSITSLYLDADRSFGNDSLVSSSDIMTHRFAEGIVVLDTIFTPLFQGSVKVVYKAGWKASDAPADFKQIIINRVAAMLLEGVGGVNVVEEADFIYRPTKLRQVADDLAKKYRTFF